MNNINLYLATGTEEEVIKEILQCDEDMENYDCLYDIAKKKGFESNIDYILSETAINHGEDKIRRALFMWLDAESYYKYPQVSILPIGENQYAVAVAFGC